MARFQQIRDSSNNPELATIYKDMRDSGFGGDTPINWFTAQSERPDILAATWALARGITLQGELPPTVKQMIAGSLIPKPWRQWKFLLS
jgi:hypothetical protein